MGVVTKCHVRQLLWMLSLAVSVSFYPIERAVADNLPRLVSRDSAKRSLSERLSLDGQQNVAKSRHRLVAPSIDDPTTTVKIQFPNYKSPNQTNNYWYAGASVGVTFLGDLNVTQRFDPLQNGVSQFSLQLRNLGDILSQLEQSQFAQIIRTSLFDLPAGSSQSLDNLTPQQAGDLFNQLANNPASARSLLRQSGISPQTFNNLLTASGTALNQPQTVNLLPSQFRDTPANIARLNQLGQDLNLLGELLRRAQTLNAGNANGDPNMVESKSAVRTSSGIGLGTFVGYKFVDVRVEAELFYSSNAVSKVRSSSPLTGNNETGASGSITNTTIAINGYYDLPVNWQLKPYIGVGIGLSYLSTSSLDLGFGQVGRIDRQPLFTYQLKAGLSLPIAERTDLFMQYRYLNTAGFTSSGNNRGIPISNTVDSINLQSLEIGAKFGL